MILRRLLLPTLLLTLTAVRLSANAEVDRLLPLQPEVRQVINESCVMCHGEVINGEKETRDDLDLSTDDSIRSTLVSAGKLKQVIAEGKMPHKPRLSKRLRGDAAAQAKLDALRANFDAKGHKEIILAWLKDVVATTGDDKNKK
jgi:hypothetical protein